MGGYGPMPKPKNVNTQGYTFTNDATIANKATVTPQGYLEPFSWPLRLLATPQRSKSLWC